jgi:hypothetical protein
MYTTNGDPSFADGSYNGAVRAFALSDNSTGHYNSAFARAHSNPILPAKTTPPPVTLRYLATLVVTITRLPEGPALHDKIAELRSEIRNLASMVNEQASELRKVSEQMQINAAAQAIAKNP